MLPKRLGDKIGIYLWIIWSLKSRSFGLLWLTLVVVLIFTFIFLFSFHIWGKLLEFFSNQLKFYHLDFQLKHTWMSCFYDVLIFKIYSIQRCYPTTDKRCCWIGGFRVTGKMSTQCSLSDPISGELTVQASAVPIQSIDIHLLRVESILAGEKIVTETSLIQTTQACSNLHLLFSN